MKLAPSQVFDRSGALLFAGLMLLASTTCLALSPNERRPAPGIPASLRRDSGMRASAPQTQGTATPQSTPAQTPVPAAPKISEIIVTGNKTLSSAFIIAASGHKVGDPATEQVLSEMVTNLVKTGYFGMHSADPEDAVKVHSEEANPGSGMARVFIEVDENDTIHNVTITGSGPIKPEDVRALLHVNTQTGSVYNDEQFRRDIDDIQDLYNRKGYTVAAAGDTGPDPKNPGVLVVDLIVTRVAEIKIAKTHKTNRKVILRAMQTKEGDYFNRITFTNDLRRLVNLDLFEDVLPQYRELGPGRIGITLSLPEKRTGTVNVGVGYSNRENLIGFAEIAETNFRGMGEAINMRWETGGPVNRTSVELGFTEPWLDNRQTSLSVQVYDRTIYRFANSFQNLIPVTGNVTKDTNYNEQRVGSTITVSRPFRQTYRAAISLRGEDVRTDPLALSQFNSEIVQNGPIFALGGTLLHNTRDLDLDPVTGGYQAINVEAGYADLRPAVASISQGIFGTTTFAKTSLESRLYFSLQGPRSPQKPTEDKRSVAMRLILASSAGRLPFFEQFFVGGADSLRGYREDRFWGANMFLGSVELRLPLAPRLVGVIFSDVGDAWGGPYSNVEIAGFTQHPFRVYPSIGLGMRVTTPLGPIRLDYGYGLEGGQFHFSIGHTF